MFITTNKAKNYDELKNSKTTKLIEKINSKLKITKDFVLYKNFIDNDYKNKEKVVVLTSNFNNEYISFLADIVVNTMFKYSNYKYLTILNAYSVNIPQDTLDKPYIISGVSLSDFSKICSNFNRLKNEIYNTNDKIITLGNALYSITQNSTINQLCFQENPFSFPFFITNRFDECSLSGTKIYPLSQMLVKLILANTETRTLEIQDKEKEIDNRLKIIFKDIFNIIEYPQPKKIVINNIEELDKVINYYSNDKFKYIAWDTETSSLTFWKAELGCITFTFDGVVGYYLSYKLLYNNKDMLVRFNNLINSKISILANGKYDLKILLTNNFKNLRIDNDVIALGRVIDNERFNGLKPLSYYYTNLGGYDDYLDVYKKENNLENYLDIPQEILSQYAILDSIVTYRAYFNQIKHLRLLDIKLPNDLYYKTHEDKYLISEDNYKYKERSLEYNYRNLVIPTINTFVNIELEGMYIDVDMHKKMSEDLLSLIRQYYKKFDDAIGLTKFNELHSQKFQSTSSTQLAFYLENFLHWHCIERTQAKHYKLSDAILESYKKDHPEVEYLQMARTLSTIFGLCAGTYDNTNTNDFLLDLDYSNKKNNEEDTKGWVPFINNNHKDYETDIYYITQNDKTYKVLKDQIVRTNNGKKLAQNLLETDILEI